MSSRRFYGVLLGLATAVLANSGARGDTVPPDLQTQVDALKAEVQDLKAQRQYAPAAVATPSTQPTGQDSDKNVPVVNNTTGGPGTGGLSAGWNNDSKQFFIATTGGNFYFHPGVIFQGRYDADYHRTPDKWTNGFEIHCCCSQQAVINEVVKQVLDRLSPSLPPAPSDDP